MPQRVARLATVWEKRVKIKLKKWTSGEIIRTILHGQKGNVAGKKKHCLKLLPFGTHRYFQPSPLLQRTVTLQQHPKQFHGM
jgi:hypothetical protein